MPGHMPAPKARGSVAAAVNPRHTQGGEANHGPDQAGAGDAAPAPSVTIHAAGHGLQNPPPGTLVRDPPPEDVFPAAPGHALSEPIQKNPAKGERLRGRLV